MDKTGIILGLTDIFCAVLFIAVSIPLLRRKIGMNRWYGMRFRKSFESEENWYRINEYGAKRMIFWSIILAAIGIVTLFIPLESSGRGTALTVLLLSSAPVIIIIPCIEAYLFARRL
jgi:hypothetical protein